MTIEALYIRSKRKFIYKILPIVKNWELAEDLVQDAMIKALEKYPLYDPKRSKEETWFNCILFSTVWNWKRKEKRQVELDAKPIEEFEDLFIAATDDSSFADLDMGGVKNHLHKLLLELHLKNGYSARELSTLFGLELSNTRKILQRYKAVLECQ